MVRFLVERCAGLERRAPRFSSTAFAWARELGRYSTLRLLRELGYAPDV